MKNNPVGNLWRFELRQNFRSLLIWAVFLSVVLAGFMSVYPSMSAGDFVDVMVAKMDALPPELVSALGLESYDTLRQVTGYFAYCWQFISIALVVYAIGLGSSLVAKEHEEKHIDYLATKPILPGQIVTAKTLALLALIALQTLIMWLVSLSLIATYDAAGDAHVIELARLFGKSFFIYLFFGVLAASVSLISSKTKRSNMAVLAIFFASYILGAMSKIVSSVEDLRYLSPFYMFESSTAMSGWSTGDWQYVGGLLLVCLLLLAIGSQRYRHKDLSW